MAESIPIPTNWKFQDLTGKRFGLLFVVRYLGRRGRSSMWLCECDCGGCREVHTGDLNSGEAKSCGCLKYRKWEPSPRPDGSLEIPLTRGKMAIVSPESLPLVIDRAWAASWTDGHWYAKGGSPKVFMHRLILAASPGIEIDHANGDGLDNRLENLRFCTHAQNGANSGSRKGSSSRFRGVSWNSQSRKWRVQFKEKTLGYFLDEVEAARVYDRAFAAEFGEFAKLNFPEERIS